MKLHSIRITRQEDNKEFKSIAELSNELHLSYRQAIHLFKCSQDNTICVDGLHYTYRDK